MRKEKTADTAAEILKKKDAEAAPLWAPERGETEAAGQPPLVSICCITYNHADYLPEALQGFQMQKIDFPVEILIHDDASTDGTQDLIRAFSAAHPGLVFPILRKENQYSKGITNVSRFNFERVRGKYVAMCEGDDYWCDPEKLQRQVEYLECHPDCMMTMHSAQVQSLGPSKAEQLMRPFRGDRALTPQQLVDSPAAGFPMASLVFRASLIRQLPEYYINCPVGDIPLELMAAAKGSAYYFDRPMSVYRVGVSGSWTDRMKAGDYAKKQQRYAAGMQATYRAFDRATGGRFHGEAQRAAEKIHFLTLVNTKQYEQVLRPENRSLYRELSMRTRFFIRLEHGCPGLYRLLRRLAGRAAAPERRK